MIQNQLYNLLQHVSLINNKYDDLAKITGEKFNIFSIMNMEHDERYTHSSFIAELLNPKGTHLQGDIFLKLFFNELQIFEKYCDFNFENCEVIVEEYIGVINSDYSKGGYIDIVIKDNLGRTIVIENKIYAPDQKGQLYRYKNHYPECHLIFLTLNGKQPSKMSYCIDEENSIDLKSVDLVSYEFHIHNWIELCHRVAFDQPMLREIIKQYLHLIKKITNQSINEVMSKEIRDLITEENVNLIPLINAELNNIINEVKSTVFQCIKDNQFTLKDKSQFEVKIDEDIDGLFVGYSYVKDGVNLSREHNKKGYYVNFEKANPEINYIGSTDTFFIWYNPIQYKKGQRIFISTNSVEIIRMYKNKEILNDLIRDIINEEKKYREKFINSFNN